MSARRAAFDPSRLDEEIDELLPPPLPFATTPAVAAGQPPAATRFRTDATDRVGPEHQTSAAAGQNHVPEPDPDRATTNDSTDGSTTVVAVRIPRALYDAVLRDLLGPLIERPSYAQIVAWTCQDHPGEVQAELRHQGATEARAPRGRRIAADSVPLTPRFLTAELALLDAVTDQPAGTTAGVTRTAAIVAALRVAVKQGITQG